MCVFISQVAPDVQVLPVPAPAPVLQLGLLGVHCVRLCALLLPLYLALPHAEFALPREAEPPHEPPLFAPLLLLSPHQYRGLTASPVV